LAFLVGEPAGVPPGRFTYSAWHPSKQKESKAGIERLYFEVPEGLAWLAGRKPRPSECANPGTCVA